MTLRTHAERLAWRLINADTDGTATNASRAHIQATPAGHALIALNGRNPGGRIGGPHPTSASAVTAAHRMGLILEHPAPTLTDTATE